MNTPIEPQQIVELFEARKKGRHHRIERMREVQQHYKADLVIPLPELDEAEKPATVNILAQGVDQLAMRIAGVMPAIVCPPLSDDDSAVNRARRRRLAVTGWLDMNSMGRFLHRRARYLVAYGVAPVTLSPMSASPLHKEPIPFWRNRNPLCTFPSHLTDEDIEPLDVIFSGEITLAWLRAMYPEKALSLYKGDNPREDMTLEILEYQDANEIVLIVCGPRRDERTSYEPGSGTNPTEVLKRTVNQAGVPLIVSPGRITLDEPTGHFDGSLGMFQRRAKLQAYEEVAIYRGLYAEQWVQSHPAAPSRPHIVKMADAIMGEIGLIENGVIANLTASPNPLINTAIDRMERDERVQGTTPAEMGGESASNIRTARRGNDIMSSALDPTIQEAQEILEASMEAEIVRAIAIQKAYRPSSTFSFHIPRNGQSPRKDYSTDDFDTDWVYVKYSMPGVDAAGIPIEIGQRVGIQEMSLQTARESDPMIEDPERERDLVELEALAKALLTGLEQQIVQGQADPRLVARIAQKKNQSHDPIWDVMLAVDEEMKAEQAQQQAEQAQAGPPGQQGGQPGMGAQMATPGAPPSVNGPSQGQMNVAQLLSTLRTPTNQSPAEQQLAGAGAGPQQ